MNNQLIVCGDSWMTPTIVEKFKGTHFSEIISEELSLEVIPFSKGGMSNGGICITIEEAIRLNPKLILIGTTYYDRGEIIYPYASGNIDKLKPYHIEYEWAYDLSYRKFTKVQNSSEIYSIPFSNHDHIPDHQKKTLKKYLTDLYHPGYKIYQDNMMLYAAFHKLVESKINFIFVVDNTPNFINEIPWIDKNKNYAYKKLEPFLNYNNLDVDPGYHTSVDNQKAIAEILLENYINE